MQRILLFTLTAVLISACSDKDEDPQELKENNRGVTIEDTQNQPSQYDNWFIKDPIINQLEGVSSEKAISELRLKHTNEIIVAVIDSGVDVHHEDLQGRIWVNAGESGVDANGVDKSSNGIDDDNNGYVDDVYGWNFIGGKNGSHVDKDTLEVTREFKKYSDRIANGETLSREEAIYFEKVKTYFNTEVDSAKDVIARLSPEKKEIDAAVLLLQQKLNMTDFSKENLEAISSTETDIIKAKDLLLTTTEKYRSVARFFRIWDYYNNALTYYYNPDFNSRSIVGDNPSDFNDVNYGNNDVIGPDASHGTHVAGIIAAAQGNGIGINGIAVNVKIMVLRVVPDGDERDKDVALAVRYATDMGAHIINMSFGKSFSPDKDQVDQAFNYAAQKGVLLVHAAGNDGKDNDLSPSFPNRYVKNAIAQNIPSEIDTWLDVGASSKLKDLNLPANFSNFGDISVDLFAPGHLIASTVPGNQYATYSGTSMAAPTVSGVAALLWSQFEGIGALQVKKILLHTTRLYKNFDVRQPGAMQFDLLVPFYSLSKSGGVVDAFSSIQYANQLAE